MLFRIFLLVSLPCAAFLGGYRATEHYFRTRVVPFPFEGYGRAVGAACFFWTLGAIILIWTVTQKRRTSR